MKYKDLSDYYSRSGDKRSHQADMYQSGDVLYKWYQNHRREAVKKLMKSEELMSDSLAILDVGAAEGLYLGYANSSILVGCDIARPKLKRALSETKKGQVEFINADATYLPFRDESFDMVICLDVIRFTLDPYSVTKEIRRVANRTVIIQSNTHYFNARTIFSSRPIRRPLFEVEKDLKQTDLGVDFWMFSPRSFLKIVTDKGKGQVKDTIALLPFQVMLGWLFYRVLKREPLLHDRKLEEVLTIADSFQRYLGNRFPFNRLGVYTTLCLDMKPAG
jgi:hypothetical protein